jgi:hypothetical protein
MSCFLSEIQTDMSCHVICVFGESHSNLGFAVNRQSCVSVDLPTTTVAENRRSHLRGGAIVCPEEDPPQY